MKPGGSGGGSPCHEVLSGQQCRPPLVEWPTLASHRHTLAQNHRIASTVSNQ